MAEQPQALDASLLIRRKKGGEGEQAEYTPVVSDQTSRQASGPAMPVEGPPPPRRAPAPAAIPVSVADNGMRMKPRESVQLAAVHVRIPEQLARGLRLMSVLEGRQAQVIVAEMLEEHLDRWNANWRASVPPR